jgi:hypothetical protein
VKRSELIQWLNKAASIEEDPEVMILDSFNGAGRPREINLGPILQKVTEENAEESEDCADFVNTNVLILGYGFY